MEKLRKYRVYQFTKKDTSSKKLGKNRENLLKFQNSLQFNEFFY